MVGTERIEFKLYINRLIDSQVVECMRSRVQSPVKDRVIPNT